MKKWFTLLSICLILLGCSNEESDPTMKQLSRVDVGDRIIADQETLDSLRKIFEQIEWEQNVKAEMLRKEDVNIKLFFEVDPNMPERLVEYAIWFNEGNGTATINDRTANAFGKLYAEGALTLSEILTE